MQIKGLEILKVFDTICNGGMSFRGLGNRNCTFALRNWVSKAGKFYYQNSKSKRLHVLHDVNFIILTRKEVLPLCSSIEFTSLRINVEKNCEGLSLLMESTRIWIHTTMAGGNKCEQYVFFSR